MPGWLAEAADRIVASDPGAARLRMAGTASAGMASALAVEFGFATLTHAGSEGTLIAMLLGAVVAMMGSMALVTSLVGVSLAATNADLEELVRQRRFREDLYYRLNVVPIVIPPLRDRAEDIPVLADYFLQEFTTAYGRKPKELTEGLEHA